MNIIDVIDDLHHLKLIVHFDELSNEELEKLKAYGDKVEICSFDSLMVYNLIIVLDFISNDLKIYLFEKKMNRKLEKKI